MPYGRCVIYSFSGDAVSVSAWASESDAQAADEAAKQWVSENMDAQVVSSFVGDDAWLEFAQQ
jgi:hypothetical protein